MLASEYKDLSVLGKPLSVRDVIWLRAASFCEKELEIKEKDCLLKQVGTLYSDMYMLGLDLRAMLIDIDNLSRAEYSGKMFDERNLPSVIAERRKFIKTHRKKRADEYSDAERKERVEAVLTGKKTVKQLEEWVEIEEDL